MLILKKIIIQDLPLIRKFNFDVFQKDASEFIKM